jgi:hypothetical protein
LKGHVAIDPDSEIITAAEVGAANRGDGEMMPELLEEFAPGQPEEVPGPQEPAQSEASADDPRPASEPPQAPGDDAPAAEAGPLEPGLAV